MATYIISSRMFDEFFVCAVLIGIKRFCFFFFLLVSFVVHVMLIFIFITILWCIIMACWLCACVWRMRYIQRQLSKPVSPEYEVAQHVEWYGFWVRFSLGLSKNIEIHNIMVRLCWLTYVMPLSVCGKQTTHTNSEHSCCFGSANKSAGSLFALKTEVTEDEIYSKRWNRFKFGEERANRKKKPKNNQKESTRQQKMKTSEIRDKCSTEYLVRSKFGCLWMCMHIYIFGRSRR